MLEIGKVTLAVEENRHNSVGEFHVHSKTPRIQFQTLPKVDSRSENKYTVAQWLSDKATIRQDKSRTNEKEISIII
jgi:hypothetical protein